MMTWLAWLMYALAVVGWLLAIHQSGRRRHAEIDRDFYKLQAATWKQCADDMLAEARQMVEVEKKRERVDWRVN